MSIPLTPYLYPFLNDLKGIDPSQLRSRLYRSRDLPVGVVKKKLVGRGCMSSRPPGLHPNESPSDKPCPDSLIPTSSGTETSMTYLGERRKRRGLSREKFNRYDRGPSTKPRLTRSEYNVDREEELFPEIPSIHRPEDGYKIHLSSSFFEKETSVGR